MLNPDSALAFSMKSSDSLKLNNEKKCVNVQEKNTSSHT